MGYQIELDYLFLWCKQINVKVCARRRPFEKVGEDIFANNIFDTNQNHSYVALEEDQCNFDSATND